jgi:hypothetical protein
MLKNTTLTLLLFIVLNSCQKTEVPSPDPLPPAVPEDYLVKIQTEYTININGVNNYRNIDSLIYNQERKLVGRRYTAYKNEVLTSSGKEDYRFSGNQLFIANNNGNETRSATIDLSTGYLLSMSNQRNYGYSPTDTILWADDIYEYDAVGFQKKHWIRVKVVNKIGDLRWVFSEDNVDTFINDGKNIVKRVYLIKKLDSAFSRTNGALIQVQSTNYRYTFTYTHTLDSMVAYPTQPYRIGRGDLNMMASETYAIENSTDGGLTWKPQSTYSKSFTHEIRDRLLQRTFVKSVDEGDMLLTYFYGKR